ncbi:hypothetical protein JVX90_13865 [Gordonia sp. PDNC005]|uniref:hypothetical protein n=1 Tax=Gordonia sp. PDNC005 TaxID=2811424 RepID=UPI00196571E2|nr:hypothetical protein [Gordonia sp. PDNC005]QRY61499.1 hypothetical protein JVX90_13865 [Gordonia sp. PDNC005]
MTSTDLQHTNNTVVPSADPSDAAIDRLLKQAQALQAAHQLGSALAGTSMVPSHFKDKPDDCAAAIMYGSEVGLSATQSLQNLFVVRGKPAMFARTMVAQVIGAGHHMAEVEATTTSVTWAGKRGDSGVEFTSTWTIERAQAAGFTSNKLYESMPIEMLRAKAQAEVARNLAPDVLLGLAHSKEELDLEQGPPIVKRAQKARGVAGVMEALGIEGSGAASAPDLMFASSAQRTELVDLMSKEPGLGSKTEALAWLSGQLGRSELLTTTEQLTADEAAQMITFLRDEQAKDASEGQA